MHRKSHDLLEHLLARKRIGRPQYLAGQKYRQLSAVAERSPEALEALAKCRAELGDAGIALVDATLLCAMSTKQIAASRGQAWESYYSRRLGECLATLAIVFGFAGASPRRPAITSAPTPRA